MKKFRQLGLIIAIALVSWGVAFGEAVPPKLGTVNKYSSDNAKYTVAIEIINYPDHSPSFCTFTESGKTVWSKQIATTPSKVVISDNGQCIAMTNWGWYDERASCSLSLYNRMGDLIKEIPFGSQAAGSSELKWIRVLAISPDGDYCIIGENTQKNSFFTVYDCRKGKLLWEKGFGFSEATEARLSDHGKYILIATNDYHSGDMQMFLLDRLGEVLRQKTLLKNLSWDVPRYLRFKENGLEFEIYDLNQGKFRIEPLPYI